MIKKLPGILIVLTVSTCFAQDISPDKTTKDYRQRIKDVVEGRETLRGVMLLLSDAEQSIVEADIRRLRNDFGANHVRLYFQPGTGLQPGELEKMVAAQAANPNDRQTSDYLRRYNATVSIFKKRWAPLFRELDLPIIVSLAGGDQFQDPHSSVWSDENKQKSAIDDIVARARAWSDLDIVLGYDLINEPIPPGSRSRPKNGWWWDWTVEEALEDMPDGDKALANLYNKAIRRIRTFDAERLIVLEPGPFGTPSALPAMLNVVDDPRLLFSFHAYTPHTFTSFGGENWADPSLGPPVLDNALHVYPNPARGWNRATIDGMFDFAKQFQQARETQTGRHCPVWIGEFGATRFTDSASQKRWFTDVLELMEQYHFGYAWFVYTAGVVPRWDLFSQYGLEGGDVNLPEYFNAFKQGDRAYFLKFQDTTRPSFDLLVDFMRRKAP